MEKTVVQNNKISAAAWMARGVRSRSRPSAASSEVWKLLARVPARGIRVGWLIQS